MTKYVAIINTPGYLPDSDEPPPTFDNAADAWQYLADERERDEDSAAMAEDDSGEGYSETLDELRGHAGDASLSLVGTVYGPTPGYDGEHDLGIAYSVEIAEDDGSEESET